MLAETKKKYAEKEAMSEAKRQEFEAKRKREKEMAAEAARQKQI